MAFLLVQTFFCLLVCSNILAQETATVTVSGRIVDEKTSQPLRNVNVFLAHTMMGSATDDDGYFEIESVPLGTYELVVSHVGYVFQQRQLKLDHPRDRHFEIAITARVMLLDEVEVDAARPKQWYTNLEEFERYFLGQSPNASSCKIMNPEVLAFRRASDKRLTAEAQDMLIIENRALGYRLNYVLLSFEAEQGSLSYVGRCYFEPLQVKDATQTQTWQSARRRSYEGSLRHFLAGLCAGAWKNEGFAVQELDYIPADLQAVDAPQADPTKFLTRGGLSFERRLSFPNVLQVTYKRENADRSYLEWIGYRTPVPKLGVPAPPVKQTSWVVMNHVSALLDTSGYLFNPLAIKVYGYWSWEGVAELLPYEFSPDKD